MADAAAVDNPPVPGPPVPGPPVPGPTSTVDIYIEAVKGKVPVSKNAGSAAVWCPDGPVTPDLSYTTLRWLSGFGLGSAVGLTDFYLRSPLTGLIKLGLIIVLSAGTKGLGAIPMLLWGALESIHIWTEKKVVLSYGMSAPFGIVQGIGQGMITDNTTYYRQKKNFALWQLLSLFDFAGLQSFYEMKFALGIRKFVDFILFCTCVFKGVLGGYMSGNYTGMIFGGIFAVIFGLFIFVPYSHTVTNTLNPSQMFKTGYTFDKETDGFLNFFTMWTSFFSPETAKGVKADVGFNPVSAETLGDMFKIKRESDNSPALKKDLSVSAPTGVCSLILGNAASPLLIIIFEAISWLVKLGRYALGDLTAESFIEGVRSLYSGTMFSIKSVTKAIPGGSILESATEGLPGVGTVFKSVTGELPGVGDVLKGAAAGLPGAATLKSVTGGLKGAAGDFPGVAALESAIDGNLPLRQSGGARTSSSSESLSTEAIALGATVAALIAGGAIKLVVDSLVTQ